MAFSNSSSEKYAFRLTKHLASWTIALEKSQLVEKPLTVVAHRSFPCASRVASACRNTRQWVWSQGHESAMERSSSTFKYSFDIYGGGVPVSWFNFVPHQPFRDGTSNDRSIVGQLSNTH